MIKQLEYSESIRVPRDQKTAHAALRLLGAFEAGTGTVMTSNRERFIDQVRRELVELEGRAEHDKQARLFDPVLHERIAKLQTLLIEYQA